MSRFLLVCILVCRWTSLLQAFVLPERTARKVSHSHKDHVKVGMVDEHHVSIIQTVLSSSQPHPFYPYHFFDSPALLLSDNTDPSVAEPVTYSKWSYYTTLSLYALSFPGLWSQIKRSTKAKLKRKTYVTIGDAVEGGKNLRQQAGEIMAYMKANNYQVVEAGEVITFRGVVQKSTSQGFFLVFITALALASLALVLQIQFQDASLPLVGTPNWFYLVLLSPYAGVYYWRSGDRVDEVKVKLASNDDETENEITIEGDDEELDRMWRTLGFREKGMVKVEGILSTLSEA